MHGMENTGNMAQVYRSVRRRATKEINQVVRFSANIEAEIGDGASADWYLVQTFPGDDVRAVRWLSRRRFGTFRPMQQRADKRNGNAVQGWEPAFPGWLFVYVWDIKKMRSRLTACPGVMSLLCFPGTETPVPVNQPDEHGQMFIDKLRALSWVYNDNAPRQHRHTHTLAKSPQAKTVRTLPRRPTKQERKALNRLKNDFRSRGLEWDEATWANANRLEPHQRIALLTKTLNAAPPL